MSQKDDFIRKLRLIQSRWSGVIATIMMCFILAFSIRWIRVKSYDLFLITDILLALVTLVTLFYHTSERFSGEYDYFLWACVAFWSFDRVCRIGRVLFFLAGGKMKSAMVNFSDEDEVSCRRDR